MKKFNAFFMLLVILLAVLLINIFLTSGLGKDISNSIAEAKEKARPADIELMVITNPDCSSCTGVEAAIDSIKGKNNIKGENVIDFKSQEGQQLINDYGIEKIPSVVVKGELEKAVLSGFEERNDAMVLADIAAPYTDALTGDIKGLVKLIHIKDSGCERCFDFTSSVNQLKQGVVIAEEKTVEYSSDEGKGLIESYGFDKIPAIVLSEDLSAYPVAETWEQIGEIADDRSYTMTAAVPPYINLTTKKVVGLVELTYLADEGCTGCYDVNLHKGILLRYGINPVKEETVDVSSSEGQALVDKYGITAVPTIILSKEAVYYTGLSSVWKQVGSIADDGSYVFIGVKSMGKYRDLSTGEIIG